MCGPQLQSSGWMPLPWRWCPHSCPLRLADDPPGSRGSGRALAQQVSRTPPCLPWLCWPQAGAVRADVPCEFRGGWSLLRPEPLQWGSRTLREIWAGGKRGWFPRPIGTTAASLPKWISPSSEPNSVWCWVKGQAGVMSLGPIDETQEVTLLTQDTGGNRVEAFCPVGDTDHCSPLQLRPLWPLHLKARRSG